MIPLHVHSWYSLLEGVDSPDALVRHAAACGYRSLALTDTNGLYGAVVFRDAAARHGVRPIFGATLDVGGRQCVALVANRTGYENLCRLITAIRLEESDRVIGESTTTDHRSPITDHRLPRLIPPLADGLHLLTADLELAESLYRELGPQRVWLELVRPGSREHEWRLWRLHERLGIPLVASTNVRFATPAGFERHRLVTAIRENTLLERIPGGEWAAEGVRRGGVEEWRRQEHSAATREGKAVATGLLHSSLLTPHPPLWLAHPHHALHSPAVIEQLFADLPVAVENAAWLAERCEPDVLPRGPFIPQARVPAGMTAEQYLWALCRQGLEGRYGRESRVESREPEAEERRARVGEKESKIAGSDARKSIPHIPFAVNLSGPQPSTLDPQPAAARERLEREMAIITGRKLADYFLVVREVVMFSRERGLPVALRGSGGNCLTAYLVGITDVDPLEYGLPMERFLHEGRENLPDLDIDFCWRVRDRVIEHVFERFGHAHTAMISTHITLQARSAFREVAKVHGLSEAEVSRLIERLPERVEELMEEGGREEGDRVIGDRVVGDQVIGGKSSPQDHPLPITDHRSPSSPLTTHHSPLTNLALILAQARSLIGAPHHLSIHPGGVVITPRPIDHYVPLERSQKGVIITQFEKDAAEAVGLVKFDLLGNRSLSTVAEGMRRAVKKAVGSRELAVGGQKSEDRGQRSAVGREPAAVSDRHFLLPTANCLLPSSSYRVPAYDKRTAEMLQRGDTIGVGQLESPAMRHLLIMLRPKSLYDVMQALALIRPGAASIGCKELFVERRRRMKPVEVVHPCLEPVLRETYGLMLYEDDAMHVVAAMTGLALGESDRFRKGITKCKTDEDRERWSREFLRRAVEHGVPIEAAKEQWVHIAKFNAYSFCKSHAASYAQLAWAGAYLKAHHPLAFWVAALNNNQGMYEKRVYIEAAKRAGIRVLLPCVNRSGAEFGISGQEGDRVIGDRVIGERGTFASHRLPITDHRLPSVPAIRIGLNQIAGLSEKTRERILSERERRTYRSLDDLLARVPLGPEEAALLIRCGAADFTGRPRPELMLEAALVGRSATSGRCSSAGRVNLEVEEVRREGGREWGRRAEINHSLAGCSTTRTPHSSLLTPQPPTQLQMFRTHDSDRSDLPFLSDYSPSQRLRDEFELLRVSVGPHLMAVFRSLVPRRLIDSRALGRSVGRRVTLAGIVATARHAPTKNGDTMQFVTLEDEYGVFEVTLFPDLCSRQPYLRLGPYVVEGDVENQYGVVTVTARRFDLFDASVGVESLTVAAQQPSNNVRQAIRNGVRLR